MLLLLFLFMWIEKDGSLATEGTHLQVSRLALTNIISQKISVKISVKSCYTDQTFPSCAEILFPASSSFVPQINALYSVL